MQKVNIIWFRRDLRLEDNTALYHALRSEIPVLPIFIFDKNILDKLEDKADRRVAFIYSALNEMQQRLLKVGSSLEVYYGTPLEIFKVLLDKYRVEKVFTNHDYEPYALEREKVITQLLENHQARLVTYKDQVVFEKYEVTKEDGSPYTIFTPYSRKWNATFV
jgi:deoxyribodipyrimidine photo-lyase